MQHTSRIPIDNIDSYVKTITGYSLISPEREVELATAIRNGSPEESAEALRELVSANLRLVIKIAHDFKKYSLDFADLVCEGNVGLMTAARRFDPGKGAKFSCYAAWWIKQAMRKAIAENTRTVKLPIDKAKHQVLLERVRDTWMQTHCDEPTPDDLARESGLSLKVIEGMLHIVTSTVSLNEHLDADDDSEFTDVLPDADPAETEARERRFGFMRTALAELSDLDREIITCSFGVDAPALGSLVISQETGIPAQRVEERVAELLPGLREAILLREEQADSL